MFIYIVYELSTRPHHHAWVFEYVMYHAKKNDGVVIAQQKYFDWLLQKEEGAATLNHAYEYKTSNPSDMESTHTYAIPEWMDREILEIHKSYTKAWFHMLSAPYQPMEKWLDNIFNEISLTSQGPIEGIVLFAPFYSLEQVAKSRNIPLFYWDIAPLRYPTYQTAAYLDFLGTQGARNEAAARYDIFKSSLEEDARIASLILSPQELLAIFLSDEHLEKLSLFDQEPVYEWGIAMSPNSSFTCAFYNLYLQSEFLQDLLLNMEPAQATLRVHPGDAFNVKSDAWSGAIDASADTESFLLQCRRIACVGTKTAFLAMLWGRLVHIINAAHTVYAPGATHTLSAADSRPTPNAFINFMAFAYFVPMEYFNDPDYLRWRLTKPSEATLYRKHLNYYLSQLGTDLDQFLEIGQDQRLAHILDLRRRAIASFPQSCQALEGLSNQDALAYCTHQLRSSTLYDPAKLATFFQEHVPPQAVSDLGFCSSLDTPFSDTSFTGRFIWVEGWAFHGSGLRSITASLGDAPAQPVVYGLRRPDVLAVYPDIGTINTGFAAWLDTNGLQRKRSHICLTLTANNGQQLALERPVDLAPLA